MFKLIDLPYAPDALEPVISANTLSFHHGKHLQTYVDNLNKLIAGTEYEAMPLEQIVVDSFVLSVTGNPAIFNNAGQVYNHNMYFTQFAPADKASHEPSGALAAQIVKQWGSLDAFKADFEAKGVGLFGSGWVWLSAEKDGTLVISQEPNACNPLTDGRKPILTFDVWEHAYYLDYQNRRAAQLNALWGIVDWKVVETRFMK